MTRIEPRNELAVTKARVAVFEIVKQKSNSAMKKYTIAHISKAYGRLKIIAMGSRP